MKTHLVTITKRKIFVPSVDDSTINTIDRGSDQVGTIDPDARPKHWRLVENEAEVGV